MVLAGKYWWYKAIIVLVIGQKLRDTENMVGSLGVKIKKRPRRSQKDAALLKIFVYSGNHLNGAN